MRRLRLSLLMGSIAPLVALGVSAVARAEDFKQTTDAATVAYEGPSTRSTKQFVYSRGTPLEVLVSIEGWLKVRDAQGALVWIERRALGDRVNVQVKSTTPADVLSAPDAASPVAFRVDGGVLLSLVSPPTPATGAFVQVRHRDGQTGFVRIDALFGL
jgi:SH3-like domain-containing protein